MQTGRPSRRRGVLPAAALLAALLAHPAPAAADAAAARAAIGGGDPAAAEAACAGPAEAGDADCQNVLGWLALEGRPGLGGAAGARAWFGKAAAQGHRKALRNLAFMLARGLGGPADVERAAALYREADAAPAAPPASAVPSPEAAEAPAPPAPARERSLEARYRSAYADLLRLRALHGLGAPDGGAPYVGDAEMAEAERLAAGIGGAARAAGVGVEAAAGEVERAQRIMLRLLARPRAAPGGPDLRAEAEAALRRLEESARAE